MRAEGQKKSAGNEKAATVSWLAIQLNEQRSLSMKTNAFGDV